MSLALKLFQLLRKSCKTLKTLTSISKICFWFPKEVVPAFLRSKFSKTSFLCYWQKLHSHFICLTTTGGQGRGGENQTWHLSKIESQNFKTLQKNFLFRFITFRFRAKILARKICMKMNQQLRNFAEPGGGSNSCTFLCGTKGPPGFKSHKGIGHSSFYVGPA